MNTQAFFDSIRPLFGKMSAQQVAGMERLLAAMDYLPMSHQAYLLATSFHETARRMQPVRETLASTDGAAVKILDRAFAKGQLPWVKTPYWHFDTEGKTWLGRGDVQTTHKTNYAKAAQRLGVDLLGNPNLMLQPTVSARALVLGCSEGWYTGKKLADYLPGDYVNARRVVNGTDKAVQIAGYAARFETALIAGGAVKRATTPAQAPKPISVTLPKPTPKAPQGSVVVLLLGAAGAALVALWNLFVKG